MLIYHVGSEKRDSAITYIRNRSSSFSAHGFAPIPQLVTNAALLDMIRRTTATRAER
jgi:hypothetical protein